MLSGLEAAPRTWLPGAVESNQGVAIVEYLGPVASTQLQHCSASLRGLLRRLVLEVSLRYPPVDWPLPPTLGCHCWLVDLAMTTPINELFVILAQHAPRRGPELVDLLKRYGERLALDCMMKKNPSVAGLALLASGFLQGPAPSALLRLMQAVPECHLCVARLCLPLLRRLSGPGRLAGDQSLTTQVEILRASARIFESLPGLAGPSEQVVEVRWGFWEVVVSVLRGIVSAASCGDRVAARPGAHQSPRSPRSPRSTSSPRSPRTPSARTGACSRKFAPLARRVGHTASLPKAQGLAGGSAAAALSHRAGTDGGVRGTVVCSLLNEAIRHACQAEERSQWSWLWVVRLVIEAGALVDGRCPGKFSPFAAVAHFGMQPFDNYARFRSAPLYPEPARVERVCALLFELRAGRHGPGAGGDPSGEVITVARAILEQCGGALLPTYKALQRASASPSSSAVTAAAATARRSGPPSVMQRMELWRDAVVAM
mmetsp:Transcript_37961/g.80716  ORF Transcript_37961/g.80716 Transcript_37961/m.80716 type:complete len:486 (+) Transcript_37961:125-1582(+)